MNLYRSITATIFAASTFIGFILLSVLLCSTIQSPFDIIIGSVIIGLGVYASRQVYMMTKRRGPLDVMTGDNASYELDRLEPVKGDGVIKLTPLELQQKYNEDKISISDVIISIWGDHQGRHLNDRHEITAIVYNDEKNTLTLNFSDKFLLAIRNPKNILVASSYLKVINATEILWQITSGSKQHDQFNYLNTGKKIKTKSNTSWKPHTYDLGVGMNALYLQA